MEGRPQSSRLTQGLFGESFIISLSKLALELRQVSLANFSRSDVTGVFIPHRLEKVSQEDYTQGYQ